MSTLTGLRVTSLACKCVFFIQEHNAKGGPHDIEFLMSSNAKLSITTDRAQRGDEKNGVTCFVIMLTFKVIVIKVSKVADVSFFLPVTVKNSHDWASEYERSY